MAVQDRTLDERRGRWAVQVSREVAATLKVAGAYYRLPWWRVRRHHIREAMTHGYWLPPAPRLRDDRRMFPRRRSAE